MVGKESSGNTERLKEAISKRIPEGSQIFLDYDGTLVPIVINPEGCFAPDSLITLLKKIGLKHDLFIVSGRSMEDLRMFLGTDFKMIAMHGALAQIDGKVLELAPGYGKYIEKCREIQSMKLEKKYSGLRVYPKGGGILFHLGLVKPEKRGEIIEEVDKISMDNEMEVYHGKEVVEIKIPGVNKGLAIQHFRNGRPCLIAGDEGTDEMAFGSCPDCLSVHVGNSTTKAEFSVEDVNTFLSVLESLI